jgi:hypothetical protein
VKQKSTLPPLESGLSSALKAVHNQIERELQRNPEQTAMYGVKKWVPMQKRVEQLTTFLIDQLQDKEITLEALLVIAQSTTKVASIVSSDVGAKGLGNIRAEYVQKSLELIERDCREGMVLEATQ